MHSALTWLVIGVIFFALASVSSAQFGKTMSDTADTGSTKPATSAEASVSKSAAQEGGVSQQSTTNPDEKYREGRVIRDRQATFKVTGDRVELVPSDGHRPMTVLENLALERVKNELIRVGDAMLWDVSAMVTEFEGANYLLLQRATLSSGSQAPREVQPRVSEEP